ncbi:hypothetical protein GCM10022408_29730 [Hymenobacter fastidiosus]|uniref:AAA family ATPase n=1 Tax=Hymenobacter fastidiosus TaxID=486264 RepID=A0ABP7SPA7_9BACT
MTLEQVRRLVALGESIHLEFKEAAYALPETFFETACAFLNRDGGTILLGVKNDGTILGVQPEAVEAIRNNIATQSNNSEKLDPACVLFPTQAVVEGKIVLCVQVVADSQLHRTKGAVYDRSEDGDFRVVDPARIAELYNRKKLFYTEGTLYEHLRFEDLRADLFPKVRRLMANRNPEHPWLALDDRQLLAKAGLFKRDYQTGKEGYTLAAALLFGQDEVIAQIVPHHRVDVLVRRQNLERYDDRLDVRTNLIETYVLVMEFIGKHLPDSFHLEGTTRVSLRDKIFREVVANILVHREYTNARPTTLVIYADRVEAENANVPHHGSGPVQLDNFAPYPKNPSIAKFFLQLGRVDELGSGILNVTKYLPQYVRGAVPRFVDGNIFQTILPLAVYPLGVVADLWLDRLQLRVAEVDQQAAQQLAVGESLRSHLDDPERLFYELGTSWMRKGHRLNLDKTVPDDEIPDFAEWQDTSPPQKGNRLLSVKLRHFAATLFVCLEPKPLAEVMQLLGVSSRSRFKTAYTDALIQRGLLALTLPDIPSSPNQRYQTTQRGQEFLSGS